MRKHTITDAEAQRVLAGEAPDGRPELAELAASIAEVRHHAMQAEPTPSAALAARLEQPTLGASVGAEPTSPRGIKKMVASIAGLGIAAKVAAATGVLALGLAGVGAAGALPGPAQDAFDEVVSTIVVTDDEGLDDGLVDECTVDDGTSEGTDDGALESTVDDGTDEGTEEGVDDGTDDGTDECVADEAELPVGSKEFSAWVVQGAQDPDKVGAEFGAEVSEQARELRDEKAEERAENGTGNGGASNGFGNGGRDDDDTDDAEDAPREGGKPEGVGGGRP